jgi:DNA (cytosine-5)-methyltransferase 1
MRVLSLFSGGGLGDYGLELAGMEIVGQVEIDDYCQKILKLRWPDVPTWKDINDPNIVQELISLRPDLILGGFPCPAFSMAGKRGGLWQDWLMIRFIRIIEILEPKWVIAENVMGFTKWMGVFRNEIERIGYEYSDAILDARDFGLPQARKRYFGVCVQREELPDSQYLWGLQGKKSKSVCRVCPDNSHPKRRWTHPPLTKMEWRTVFAEAPAHRNVNGDTNRMDRLKMLGNGITVPVVEWIGRRIMEFEQSVKEKP